METLSVRRRSRETAKVFMTTELLSFILSTTQKFQDYLPLTIGVRENTPSTYIDSTTICMVVHIYKYIYTYATNCVFGTLVQAELIDGISFFFSGSTSLLNTLFRQGPMVGKYWTYSRHLKNRNDYFKSVLAGSSTELCTTYKHGGLEIQKIRLESSGKSVC